MVYPTKLLSASRAMLAFALASFLMMNIRFAKTIKLGGRSVLTTSTPDFLLTSDSNNVAGYSAGQALRYRQQTAKSRIPTSSASVCKQRTLDKDWFKSQSTEDEHLLTWFKNLCGGHYLEMGGLDGVRKSNSYVFNKGLDWKGVLVEASPTKYPSLVKNRPSELATVNAAVCSERQEVHWIDAGASGGIWEFADANFRKKWWRPEQVQLNQTIECVPLREVLHDHVGDNFFFDFFSLDIEGAEMDALSSLDFEKVGFGAILVESNMYGSDIRNVMVQTLLEKNGYKFLYLKNRSLWFVHQDFHEIYKGFIYA